MSIVKRQRAEDHATAIESNDEKRARVNAMRFS
jgi:hypothetical protein